MRCFGFGRKKKDRSSKKSKKIIKLELEFEEKIKAIRLEAAQELEKLKESCKNEIEGLEARHQEKFDEYRRSGPSNSILREEVRSLQIVIDMRNEDIRKLRDDLIHQREIQDDLIEAKEQNKTLRIRLEDFEAQLEKSRGDKGDLQKKFCSLENKVATLESENNRMAQVNEELRWRIQTLRTEANKENSVSISKLHHILDFIPG